MSVNSASRPSVVGECCACTGPLRVRSGLDAGWPQRQLRGEQRSSLGRLWSHALLLHVVLCPCVSPRLDLLHTHAAQSLRPNARKPIVPGDSTGRSFLPPSAPNQYLTVDLSFAPGSTGVDWRPTSDHFVATGAWPPASHCAPSGWLGAILAALKCASRYSAGSTISVKMVDEIMPPMTTVASGR